MEQKKRIHSALVSVFSKDGLEPIIRKMNQLGIKCIIHYSSIPEIFNLEIDHPDHLKRVKEVSKKLQRSNP